MRTWTVLAAALLLTALLLSCAKSKAGAQAAGPAPSVSRAADAPPAAPAPVLPGQPGRTITLAPAQPAPAPAPAKARKDTGISSLLSLGRARNLLPEDFKIGPLADPRPADPDEQQAMKTADAFLSGLAAGKVDAGLLAPDARARVSDTVSFGVDKGMLPRSWRLGSLRKRETGELSAPLRLFGAVGTAEGEITFAHVGRQWLVSDLQISLNAMMEKREKPKERFFPSSYRWMLEE